MLCFGNRHVFHDSVRSRSGPQSECAVAAVLFWVYRRRACDINCHGKTDEGTIESISIPEKKKGIRKAASRMAGGSFIVERLFSKIFTVDFIIFTVFFYSGKSFIQLIKQLFVAFFHGDSVLLLSGCFVFDNVYVI